PASIKDQQTGIARIAYGLLVKNEGTATAKNIVVSDTLPAGTDMIRTQIDPRCTANDRTVTCKMSSLAPGMQTGFVISAVYTGACGLDVENTATVKHESNDPDLSNNSATAVTKVQCDPAVNASADLSIEKSMPPTVKPNSTVTATVRIYNAGPDTATPVSVIDYYPVPEGWTLNKDVTSDGCTIIGTKVQCDNLKLGKGESKTLIITYNIPPVQACIKHELQTAASVASLVKDPNPGNNQITASTTLICEPVQATALTIGMFRQQL
ncbi:MAG: hypothetical protein Greene041619_1229, partial [Candidatus Peregrinibacteria bacterium Greene0416_19]